MIENVRGFFDAMDDRKFRNQMLSSISDKYLKEMLAGFTDYADRMGFTFTEDELEIYLAESQTDGFFDFLPKLLPLILPLVGPLVTEIFSD